MVIETDNLTLRHYSIDDAEALYKILSDPETMSFWPSPFTMERVCEWIERSLRSYEECGFGRYPVFLRESGEMIGDCGILRVPIAGETVNDIGYIFHHDHWGKGYAIEAATAVMNYAFDTLELDRLHANMAYDHKASRRIAEKLGMTKIREFANERNRNIWTLLFSRARGEGMSDEKKSS